MHASPTQRMGGFPHYSCMQWVDQVWFHSQLPELMNLYKVQGGCLASNACHDSKGDSQRMDAMEDTDVRRSALSRWLDTTGRAQGPRMAARS